MDDLTTVKGVGKATATKLKAAGIDTIAQLAAATPDQLKAGKVSGSSADHAAIIAEAGKLAAGSQNTLPAKDQGSGGNSAATPPVKENEDTGTTETTATDTTETPATGTTETTTTGTQTPSFHEPFRPEGADLAEGFMLVTVTGPARGRRRLGQDFAKDPQTIPVTNDELTILMADPALLVALVETPESGRT